MGGWCKQQYNKDENNKLHQKPDQMEETHWEGQNFSEVVVPLEEEDNIIKERYQLSSCCLLDNLLISLYIIRVLLWLLIFTGRPCLSCDAPTSCSPCLSCDAPTSCSICLSCDAPTSCSPCLSRDAPTSCSPREWNLVTSSAKPVDQNNQSTK